jgi:hypothetical protein
MENLPLYGRVVYAGGPISACNITNCSFINVTNVAHMATIPVEALFR